MRFSSDMSTCSSGFAIGFLAVVGQNTKVLVVLSLWFFHPWKSAGASCHCLKIHPWKFVHPWKISSAAGGVLFDANKVNVTPWTSASFSHDLPCFVHHSDAIDIESDSHSVDTECAN